MRRTLDCAGRLFRCFGREEEFDLRVTLSPAATQARLEAACDHWTFLNKDGLPAGILEWSSGDPEGERPLVGRFKGASFWLRRRSDWQNMYRVYAEGRVEPDGSGARVVGRIGRPASFHVLMWMLAVFTVAMTPLLWWHAAEVESAGERIGFTLTPVIVAVAGWLLYRFGLWLTADEYERLRRGLFAALPGSRTAGRAP